ncbi:MAG: cytochrome c3 family protein [Deltaproteobacteria bacterium]|nr:cytochrome c3 family protein [Deltaproteobacteria bacterium]
MKNLLQNRLVYFLVIILLVILYSFVGLANKSGQTTESVPPGEFSQPIEFSHKTHVEKGEIPCEFCHIYARRSINSGAPVMACCFGCHRVIAGSDEDPKKAIKNQDAIKKLLEFQPKGESIPWKKIHDVPDFVHFSHKRHIQVGFDCTECHGEIDKHDVLSTQTMITDLSMGWCMKCHREGRPAVDGKIAGPIRETRGGKIVKQAAAQLPNGTLLGATDCYTCHK